MLNFQGEVFLKEIDYGAGYAIPLFTTISFEKNGWFVIPIYGLTITGNPADETVKVTNSFGGFIKYEFHKKIGLYFIGLKDTREDIYSLGLGGELPINKYANAFIEIGGEHKHHQWEPKIIVGVSIPLTIRITHAHGIEKE
ncbi:MAG: hypothetical protein WCK16_05440 [Candidatus Moraniibacteriota bacterium]